MGKMTTAQNIALVCGLLLIFFIIGSGVEKETGWMNSLSSSEPTSNITFSTKGYYDPNALPGEPGHNCIPGLQYKEWEIIAKPGDLTKADGTVLELTPHYETHSDFHNGIICYSYYTINPEDRFAIYYKGDLIYEPRFAQ